MPEPSSFATKVTITKLKVYKSPDIEKMLQNLFKKKMKR
jgi:hypothetical protein